MGGESGFARGLVGVRGGGRFGEGRGDTIYCVSYWEWFIWFSWSCGFDGFDTGGWGTPTGMLTMVVSARTRTVHFGVSPGAIIFAIAAGLSQSTCG